MSYYRRVAEVMVFYNDNEKTKRVVQGVREYLWDIFNKVRIEALDSFALHMRCDGFILDGEFIYEPEKGWNFLFGSNVKDQSKGMHILQNLELYTDINVVLNYNGHFFYGHPYGANRMDALLKESYDEQIIYMANEHLDSDHHIYLYEENDGEVVKGILTPVETPPEYQLKLWEPKESSTYLYFSDTPKAEEKEKILAIGKGLRNTLGLKIEYESDSQDASINIDDSKMKKKYTYRELELLKQYLQQLVMVAPEKLEHTRLQFLFSVSGEKDPFREIMITHEKEGIVLGYYDPDSRKVKPYYSSIEEMFRGMEILLGIRKMEKEDLLKMRKSFNLSGTVMTDDLYRTVQVEEKNKVYYSDKIGIDDFKDKSFVLTGCTYSKEIAQFILKRRGIIKSAVSRKAEVLIFNSTNTTKHDEALKLKRGGWDIKLITEADFMKEYDIEPEMNSDSEKTEEVKVIETLVNLYEIQGEENPVISKVHLKYYAGFDVMTNENIQVALNKLQDKKIIVISKGLIEIIDSEALKSLMPNN